MCNQNRIGPRPCCCNYMYARSARTAAQATHWSAERPLAAKLVVVIAVIVVVVFIAIISDIVVVSFHHSSFVVVSSQQQHNRHRTHQATPSLTSPRSTASIWRSRIVFVSPSSPSSVSLSYIVIIIAVTNDINCGTTFSNRHHHTIVTSVPLS